MRGIKILLVTKFACANRLVGVMVRASVTMFDSRSGHSLRSLKVEGVALVIGTKGNMVGHSNTTTTRNYCHELLPGSTARNYCQELLLGTTARNYCQELLP